MPCPSGNSARHKVTCVSREGEVREAGIEPRPQHSLGRGPN